MAKLLFFSIILSTIFSLNLSAFAQPLPKLRQNMPYKEARNLLIQQGWQAVFNSDLVKNQNRSSTKQVVGAAGASKGESDDRKSVTRLILTILKKL